MLTHESRGNDTTVGFPPSAGTCSSIIMSVLTLPPSSCVESARSSAAVAPARLSLPSSRMSSSPPSMSRWPLPSTGTESPWRTPAVKFWYVAQASPLPTSVNSDATAMASRTATRARCVTSFGT
jgi:hypothetical protein